MVADSEQALTGLLCEISVAPCPCASPFPDNQHRDTEHTETLTVDWSPCLIPNR
jgi:hypothetical protein